MRGGRAYGADADGAIIVGTSVDTSGINEGIAKVQKSMKKLASVAGLVVLGKKILDLGKSAIEASSDLQEVQNIVDVAFGKQYVHKIEDFCDTCIEKFGISEYAAKNMAGSFAAMGHALGISQDDATNMAVSLTALAGDMASFYNISEDYARVALSAVYTGETETLKRYGIVLTDANLQQYALTQGITQNYRTLDSASKALLRYKYIMQQTSMVQGDFQRTSNNWANQVRVMKQEWLTFMQTLGASLKTIFKPMIQILNVLIKKLTQFLSVLYSTLHKLFGFTLDISGSAAGAADSYDNVADSLDNVKDATDDATKAAKKYLDQIQGFDELNILHTTETGGGSGSGGDGGLSSLGGIPLDTNLFGEPQDIKLPEFDSLFDVGRWVSDGISKQLEKINWNKVYSKAKNFGKGLAEFLNGLITPRLFRNVGRTIANSLNTALKFLDSFGTTFDWSNFGKSIAAGINGFFHNFNFKEFGHTVKVWVNGLWKMIAEIIKNVDWGAIFKGVADFFKSLGPDGVFKLFALIFFVSSVKAAFKNAFSLIGKALSGQWVEAIWGKAFSGVGKSLASGFTKSLGKQGLFGGLFDFIKNKGVVNEAGDVEYVGNIFYIWGVKWGSKLVSGFNTVTSKLSLAFGNLSRFVGGLLSDFVSNTFGRLGKLIGETIGKQGIFGGIFDYIKGNGFANADGTMTFVGNQFYTWGVKFADSLSAGFSTVTGKISSIMKSISNTIQLATGSGGVIDPELYSALQTLETIGGVLGIIGGSIMSIVNFVSMWKNGFDAIHEVLMIIGVALVTVGAILLGVAALPAVIVGAIVAGVATAAIVIHDNWDAIVKWFSGVKEKVGAFFSGVWETIKQVFAPVVEFFSGVWENIKQVFSPVVEFFATIWNTLWTNVLEPIASFFNTYIIQPILTFVEGLVKRIGQFVEGCWLIVQAIWIIVSGFFNTYIIQPIVNFVTMCANTIKSIVSTVWGVIQGIWNTVANFFNTYIIQPVVQIVTACANTIKSIVTTMINTVKSIIGVIVGWVNTVIIQPIKNIVTAVCNTIKNLAKNLWNGIVSIWQGVFGWFNSHLFEPIKSGFTTVVNVVSSLFSGLWDGIKNGVRGAFNFVIGVIEGAINGIINALNAPIKLFNKIGKWAGKVVGKDYGGVDLVPNVHIPRLASGAVIPPNKEFMAVLGDQKQGTNIEAPLDTIKQAMVEVLSSMGSLTSNAPIIIQIDGREVFRAVRNQNDDFKRRTGSSALA